MSEERCEKGVFVNGPTPNAPWCTEHDQPWEECYEYLRALLAEERKRRKEVEAKLADALILARMAPKWQREQKWARDFFASLKKEAEP